MNLYQLSWSHRVSIRLHMRLALVAFMAAVAVGLLFFPPLYPNRQHLLPDWMRWFGDAWLAFWIPEVVFTMFGGFDEVLNNRIIPPWEDE